jgi:SAM-dependent methyltransferase
MGLAREPAAAERIRWAVETVDPGPSERLLEIGCGAGIAVWLVCERLAGGTIVGLDRSPAMIAQAARRNQEHVRTGRAAFEVAALADAELVGAPFDKVFAVNVRLLRRDAAAEADVLRRVLARDGALYLVQQHPSAERTSAVTDELAAGLERHGFTVHDVRTDGADDAVMTCIVAGTPPPSGRRRPPGGGPPSAERAFARRDARGPAPRSHAAPSRRAAGSRTPE